MHYQVYINLVGQWQWKLVSAYNKRIIAQSAERYWNKADCEAEIKMVKNSVHAPVEEG